MSGTHSRPRGLILLALVPFVVAGCPCGGSNCGAPTPGPTLTPAQAAAAAASAAAVPSMAVELVAGQNGSCFYRATSDGALEFLDPWGRPKELVLLDELPVDDVVSVSSDQALAAARAFLSRQGLADRATPDYPVVAELHEGGVALLEVSYSWYAQGDSKRKYNIDFRILVNGKTGTVFAWNQLTQGAAVHVPIIGKARAIEIALAKYGTAGDQVLSASLTADFLGGDPQAAWQIDLGAPGATSSAVVTVDAVTGTATTEKPGARPANAQCVPVSADQAVAAAEKGSGVSGLTAYSSGSFYNVRGTDTEALVDIFSGAVDEVVFESALPETNTVTVTADAARTAAETFLEKAGYDAAGLAVSVTEMHAASMPSYQVSWTGPRASTDDVFDVFVNASTGVVFAFLDRRQGVGLVAPLIGQTVATSLATTSSDVAVTLWSRATLTLGFDSDSEWEFTLGVPDASPGPAAPTAWHNVWATVDAVTGKVTAISSNGPSAS